MIKRDKEDEDTGDVSQEISNVNELMSVTKPFTSDQYVRDILSGVLNGHVEPLAAMTVVKRFEKVAKKVLENEQFKALAVAEAEKHLAGNTKSFQLYSATICKGATYTTYDFTNCGHPVLAELYKIQQE